MVFDYFNQNYDMHMTWEESAHLSELAVMGQNWSCHGTGLGDAVIIKEVLSLLWISQLPSSAVAHSLVLHRETFILS
jgi:hypothetical protein